MRDIKKLLFNNGNLLSKIGIYRCFLFFDKLLTKDEYIEIIKKQYYIDNLDEYININSKMNMWYQWENEKSTYKIEIDKLWNWLSNKIKLKKLKKLNIK